MEETTLQELKSDVKGLQGQVASLQDKITRLEADVKSLVYLLQQGRGMARLIRWVVMVLGLIGLSAAGHKLVDGLDWLGKP